MNAETATTDARHATSAQMAWHQLGAAIDMFDLMLVACPDELWTARLWVPEEDPDTPPRFGEFWTIPSHVIRWLERYLLAVPEDEFASLETSTTLTLFPENDEPPTKETVRSCLADLRERCRSTLMKLTDDEAQRQSTVYDWISDEPLNFVELQLYNMRHVSEHTGQLSLFLGQHGVPDEKLDWIPRAR